MEFLNWFINPIKHQYADFSGRATRKQYWMYTLVYMIIYIVIQILAAFLGEIVALLGLLFSLAVLVPSVAIAARRLHDVNMSGWWQLIGIIPILGWLVMIYFLVLDSKEDNKYGPNPKGSTGGAAPVAAMPEAAAPTMNDQSGGGAM